MSHQYEYSGEKKSIINQYSIYWVKQRLKLQMKKTMTALTMTVCSILFAKGGFSWVDISLPNWWSSSLIVYGTVLICWLCSYTSWYEPLWRGRHYTLHLPPLQNSSKRSPWTSSGSHNQAWLIPIPSADTGCDSAQWCRVFLPRSHPQSAAGKGYVILNRSKAQ